ncbi:MAG: 30S ribosomal protein S1 [Spirochaetaceae bacterium]|jgi:small subunit ribosomal protein S1|nr:30S ribosomal protein S1 [Spirochaetaceae bacterium]
MIIALDGPAGSGKSSIARTLAGDLGITYINSGNLYRAFTYGAKKNGIDPEDSDAIVRYARQETITYEGDSVFLGGEDVTASLHTDEVDALVGNVSCIVPLRRLVNDIIRKEAAHLDVIVEGRDMTTVAFPDAEFRFFIDASVETRAKRRFDQGSSALSLDEIRRGIEERDAIDSEKPEGALKIGAGVEYINTSLLTLDEVCSIIKRRISSRGMNMAKSDPIGPIDSIESTESIESFDPTQGEKDDSGGNGNNGEVQTQLQEEYLKNLEQLEEGQLVTGTVIQVTQDQVFVDVGCKSEGKIAITEFGEVPNVGDEVSVVLVMKENKRGEVIVSKQKADSKIGRKNLKQAFQDHAPIEGTILRHVKGGYEVQIGGDMMAFLPTSQADVIRVDNPDSLIGEEIQALVERIYSDGKENIVISRRRFLEEEMDRKREAFFINVPVGSEVTGEVKSFTSFGAFVDLGGFDGLLHVNDMSWGHVLRPRDFVKKGQELTLKVIRIDPNQKRINLSLKHFTDDPWIHFEEKFHVNQIVKGKVTKLAEFGAFIEIDEGIEGLAHISEFSWVKKVQKPSDLVKVGDVVECMILGYDLQQGRVSLGLKQVEQNPWDKIEEVYPVGTRLTRTVVKVTSAGAFVQLEEGIDGFLHMDDLSWTKKVKHPGSELKEGDEIEVIVIAVDAEKRSIRLGVKQLTDDPWKSFSSAYRMGSLIEGEVCSVTDFGIFVKVPGGIEGLIHKSNLVENPDDNPDEVLRKYKVGDKVKAAVIEVHGDKGKAAFSIRDYKKHLAREEVSQYLAGEETDGSTFTLGDLLKK